MVRALAAAALAVGVYSCGEGPNDTDAPSGLSGTMSIGGSSTVQPFAETAAELIREISPDLEIAIGAVGTAGGFERLCAGEFDIAMASRPITPAERHLCAGENVTYERIQVANDGVVVVSNPDVPIGCLTAGQLTRLWSDGRVTRYSELGDDAETGEPLPNVETSLYAPDPESGTFDFFTEKINGRPGLSRTDYRESDDDNLLVSGVAEDEHALGYFGYSYYKQHADSLNLISVDSGGGCVEPDVEAIQSGEYAPLARPLFMYPSNEALEMPEVAAFMEFVVEGHEAIANTAFAVPMADAEAERAASTLAGSSN